MRPRADLEASLPVPSVLGEAVAQPPQIVLMTYTPQHFADELERLLRATPETELIRRVAEWAYAMKSQLREAHASVDGWLDELGVMTMGPEFELTTQELGAMVAKARATTPGRPCSEARTT